MSEWQQAERVQKNAAGEYRALIGGQWVPVDKAQKNASGQYRVMRGEILPAEAAPAPVDPVKAWRKDNALEAGAVDFIQGAGGMTKGILNLVTPSTDGKNRGVGDLLKNPAADPSSGAHFAGQLLDPVAWQSGANIARIAPYAKVLGQGGMKAVQALMKNLGVGAAAGGTVGTLTDDDPAAGGGRGAVIGALANQSIPPVARAAVGAGRWAKEVISPSPARLAADAAGDKVDDVITALERTRAQTPGATLNAGQAAADAGSAEFSALQRIVDAKNPSLAIEKATKQQGARAAALKTVAGTPEELASARGARTATSDMNYKDAFKRFIVPDYELSSIYKNPYVKQALDDAQRLADAEGVSQLGDPTQFLHYVKISLDKSMTRTGDTALSATEKRLVKKVQDRLVTFLGSKNKVYDNARAVHEQMSEPINRMELGQELESSLRGPLGQERAGPFSAAVRKAGVDTDVTGTPRIDALLPGQRKVVDSIMSDLERDRTWKSLASAGRGSALERIGAPQIPSAAGFSFALSTAKNMFNRVTGGLTEGGLKQLATLMNDDPRKLAVLMRSFTPAQRAQVQTAVERMTLPAAGGIVSATEQQ